MSDTQNQTQDTQADTTAQTFDPKATQPQDKDDCCGCGGCHGDVE